MRYMGIEEQVDADFTRARQRGCALLDAGEVVVSSDRDGVHFEAAEHRKLGEAVGARVRETLD